MPEFDSSHYAVFRPGEKSGPAMGEGVTVEKGTKTVICVYMHMNVCTSI